VKSSSLNILITGGAGFIGSHTADALIAQGHRVRILDNLHQTIHPKGRPAYLNREAEFIQGDVRDKNAWKRALKGINVVYHLAAYQDYLPDFSTFFQVNAVSTALLYEVIVEEKIQDRMQKVIVASSQAVMGEGRYQCPHCAVAEKEYLYPQIRSERQLSEGRWEHHCPGCDRPLQWLPSDETVTGPCNQYALSKHSQEQIALQLGQRYQIPTVVLRYSIVQGPRQSLYNTYSGAMRIFSLSLWFKKAPTIFEDGKQVRDFVNIQDVVRANLMVLEHEKAQGHVFNVGGGRAWTVSEFYATMQNLVGIKKAPILSGYYRFGDTRHIFSDTAKISALGWNPHHPVEDSIQSYWEYLNQQEDIDNILQYAEKHMRTLRVIRRARKTI